MDRLATAATPSRCPRCQGPLCPSQDGDLACLYCGEYVYAATVPRAELSWDTLLPRRPFPPARRGRRRRAA